ncbi:MAG: BMP family ABC transporter substrate-binding protein [Acidimicrobiia bacterium]|nr:BMP family ABC transporter substrate-binding protein [Acidimicrobiia bacterium]
MKFRRLLLVLLAFVLFAAACGSDDDDSGSGDEAGTDEAAADEGASDEGAADDEAAGGGGGEDVTAAFIYIGPPGDAGWTFAHDQGRQAAEAATGATTLFIENVPEVTEEVVAAGQTFIDQDGANLIVGTSFGFMDGLEQLAADNPDVTFEHISGFKMNDTNFGNTFGRMYEPRYLSGMAAASVSESGNLGYVAAFGIPEVVRGINAFTLGALAVNPEATVEVIWTSTWFDPTIEGNSAQALLEKGIDVLAMHQDTPSVGQAAEEAGARWVAYNSDMSEFAPTAFVTAPVWDWGPRYTEIVSAVADGSYTPEAYWGGMADGIVGLAPLADDVPDDVAAQIDDIQSQIVDGSFHPFTGPINDNQGTEVLAEGVQHTDEELLGMAYLVEGVIGEIPEG